MLVPKPLKTAKLDGISERQITEHHDILYVGYVNKVNEIREKLATVDRSKANQAYSDYRALKAEESFALNGVKLHELYFDNLGGSGDLPTGRVAELIQRDFGSVEAWVADLKAAGTAARGWVVMAYDRADGKLYNYSADAHNQGGIWDATPVLVLDVYEHAYVLDYGVKRPPYLEAFLRNIDWAEVNSRLTAIGN